MISTQAAYKGEPDTYFTFVGFCTFVFKNKHLENLRPKIKLN